MAFAGRDDELGQLAYWWDEAPDRPALIWGRRRAGKTALIEQFASGLPRVRVVFHVAAGDPEASQLRRLAASVRLAGLQGARDLDASPYHDWRDALDHLAAQAVSEPALLVLDDFPELLAGTPAMPGLLRAFLDNARGRTQLRLVLCGSAVSAMWSVLSTREPLYERFSLTLPVLPLRPAEAAMLLPDLSAEDRALVYGLVGGMPLYLDWWRQDRTVAQNLLQLAGSSGAPLLAEGRLVMKTEAGSGQGAVVLCALAAGAATCSEIAGAAGFDPLPALGQLAEARLVVRLVPAGEDPLQSRHARYRITDNLLRFYLGPVMAHRTEIERGRGQAAIRSIVAELDHHLGVPYAEAFRDCLWRKARDGSLGLDDIVEIGPWWGPDGGQPDGGQPAGIGAVLLAQPGLSRVPVAVGAASWETEVNGARLRARLTAAAAALTPDAGRLRCIAGARSKVVLPAGSGTIAITAADIFPDPA